MQIDTNIDALQFKPDLPPPYVADEVLKSSFDQIKKAELEEIESLPEVTGIKIQKVKYTSKTLSLFG